MRHIGFFVLTMIVGYGLGSGEVGAVGDTFIISALIGADTEAPTAPASLEVVPVSVDQINLEWVASSDNVSVAGYQVWRDDTHIATTTLTSYSDVGLASSTLYTYYIIAFDTSVNLSASSTLAATTTLVYVPPPVTETGTENTGSSGTRIKGESVDIFNWQVKPTEHSVEITFTTDQFVRSDIRWGTDTSYEIGYSSQRALLTTHRIFVDSLESGASYDFNIDLFDRFGNKVGERIFEVTTIRGLDIMPPPNVNNFLGVFRSNAIALTWDNPNVVDFSHVRILRSERFFPLDAADGSVVYEGTASDFLDTDLRSEVSRYYYSIFAFDTNGNRSSGAVALVVLPSDVPIEPDILVDTTPSTTLDILFQQGSLEQIGSATATVRILLGEDTIIRIPYDSLPKNLKTIVVTLFHVDSSSQFSFLLKSNSDRTYYEAVLGSLPYPGTYEVAIEVFDYKLKTVMRSNSQILAAGEQEEVAEVATFHIWYWPLLVCLLFLLYRAWRKTHYN